MTRDEFKVLVKAMKAVYAQETFIPDSDAFNVWFALLEDIPYKVANVAVQKYIVSEKFPPTIADIRKHSSEIMSPETEELNEIAAWQLVYKAVCNSGYNSESEFQKLPIAVQRTVKSPAVLRNMAMMDISSLQSVEKSHFIRNYRSEVQRMKEEAKIPPAMRKLIGEISQGIGIEGRQVPMQIGEENGKAGNL